MLPLRPNKKPQLLPIKQLLLKQKDEDDSNLNTDEYLLWKSGNESNRRKSVSFSTRKKEKQQKSQNPELNDHNSSSGSQRLRNDLFLEDTLSDSDEQDDSLRDHLNSLNRIKNYSFGDSPKHVDPSGYRPHENAVQLRKQKNSESSSNCLKNQDMNKKLIEVVSLTIREAIDDAEQNLSLQLESKIIEEVSNLKTSLKHDILQNEVDGKLEKMFQSLANFKENYRAELENLHSDLTQKIDTIPSKCISADSREPEERLRSFFMDNLAAAEKNFEKIVKAVICSSQQEKNESNMEQCTNFFDKNLKKMEELNEKLESLTQATNNVLELITELKPARLAVSSSETPRKIFHAELHSLNFDDVIKSEVFYTNIDEELERYRRTYIKSYNNSGHRDTKPAWLATIDEKWKALGALH